MRYNVVSSFQSAPYISSLNALWQLLENKYEELHPPVMQLDVYLPARYLDTMFSFKKVENIELKIDPKANPSYPNAS